MPKLGYDALGRLAMDRRQFMGLIAASGAGLALTAVSGCTTKPENKVPEDHVSYEQLPNFKKNSLTTETVLNSRRSYHSGFAGSLPDQILSNVLWATGRAPLVGARRTIYAGLPTAVYRYDPVRHELIQHLAGNHLSISGLAFEVGVISDVTEDAGIASQFGLLTATAFWAGTGKQPAFCPSASSRNNATSTWNAGAFTFANSFGLIGTVSGITTELVAISSDGSLPNPNMSGQVLLEDAVANLDYDNRFSGQDLGIGQISQIAWASYGNAPHAASNGRAALTTPSSRGEYDLAGRIYIVQSSGTDRYLIRMPGGGATSRDHRLERVMEGDRRPPLRSAAASLPPTAPVYFVYCASTIGIAQQLECGFAGAGALLQATSLGLRGYVTTDFSDPERSAIISSLGIPTGDLPVLIVSAGLPL